MSTNASNENKEPTYEYYLSIVGDAAEDVVTKLRRMIVVIKPTDAATSYLADVKKEAVMNFLVDLKEEMLTQWAMQDDADASEEG